MRVASKTLYDTSEFRLGRLTSDLSNENQVVSTGNRINRLSDDPIGLSQVLNLKSNISNLDQLEKNIDMGKTWLEGAETALDSTNDLILEIKTACSQLVNASSTIKERTDAVERVEGTIEQILGLANTQVNEKYIFGGTKTDIPPLVYNDSEDPPNVAYVGDSTPFRIKSTDTTYVDVGRNGKEVFWEESLMVDYSNNRIVFTEDTGRGENYVKTMTAIIPDGEHEKSDLSLLVRNALNEASKEEGYGVTYDVSYDGSSDKFTIREDGTFSGYVKTGFKWESGGDPRLDKLTGGKGVSLDHIDLELVEPDSLTIGTPDPSGTEPFRLTFEGNGSWRVDGNPGYNMPNHIEGTADHVEIDLTENGISDIVMSLEIPAEVGGFVEFEMEAYSGNRSIGVDLGFEAGDVSMAPHASDDRVILKSIDNTNNQFNFVETNTAGVVTNLSAEFLTGDYSNLSELAGEIERSMDAASSAGGNKIDYSVSYDEDRRQFVITKEGADLQQLDFLWSSGGGNNNATAAVLGFDVVDDSINFGVSDNQAFLTTIIASPAVGANDMIDFIEVNADGLPSAELHAQIPAGDYNSFDDLADAIESRMEQQSAYGIDYNVFFDKNINQMVIQSKDPEIEELQLLWGTGVNSPAGTGTSAGVALGFDVGAGDDDLGGVSYGSDSEVPNFMTIAAGVNDRIDFQEVDSAGKVTTLSATLDAKNYGVPDELAAEVEKQLEAQSAASGNSIDYKVAYDSDLSRFTVEQEGDKLNGVRLLWGSTPNSAGAALGFDVGASDDDYLDLPKSDHQVELFDISAAVNNMIDFKELKGGVNGMEFCELTAAIPAGKYTSGDDLAAAIEKAMELESSEKGYGADYAVSWNKEDSRFSIKEEGTGLDGFQLLWNTGENKANSAASVLGFDAAEDDIGVPLEGDSEAEWGIFNTLLDMKEYLANDDVEGLERTLTRLEKHYSYTDSVHADNGIKYNRLEVQTKISQDVSLSLTTRRANIEEADYIEAIMNLKSTELAYEAALSSTSKVLQLSLVDYM